MFFFILQIITTALIAWMMANLIHHDRPNSEKIMAFFVYAYGVPIMLMIILGIFGFLSYTAVFGSLFIITVSLFFTKKTRHLLLPAPHFDLSHLKTLSVYVPLVLFLGIKLFNASLTQVTETDSLVYHLPYAAQWFQTGHIWNSYYTAYAGPIGYYPGNHELLALFAFFPFHEDLLVNLINFPMFLALGVTLFSLAKLFNISTKKAMLAPVIFLFMPLIIRQGGIPQNDLFFLFTLSAALYFGIKNYFQNEWHLRSIFPLALCLGLFIGTKSSGIIYGSLVVLPIIWLLWKYNRRIFIKNISFFISVIFLSGGFWYFRNFILTGNPLFPLELKIGSFILLEGYPPLAGLYKNSTIMSHIDFATFREGLKSLFLSTGLLGLFGFLGFFKALFHLSWKTMPAKESSLSKLLIIAFPLTFLLYLITPFSYSNIYPNIRYLLVFFLVGYLLFLQFWKMKYARFIAAASIFNIFIIIFQKRFLSFINDYTHYDINQIIAYPIIALLGLLAISIFLSIFWLKSIQKQMAALFIGLLAFGFFLSQTAEIREKRGFSSFVVDGEYIFHRGIVEAFEFVEKHIPADARIAFTRTPAHYPLYGKRWEREVDYINVNECTTCVYHDYRDSPKSILQNPNVDHWLANLRNAKKEYLFIGLERFEKIPPYEVEWADENPKIFGLLFRNESSRVYKIK